MFTMLVSIITTVFMYFWYAVMVSVIGIYIYRKSKQYRMNTKLWVIVGVVFNLWDCVHFFMQGEVNFRMSALCALQGHPRAVNFAPNAIQGWKKYDLK